jgi:hypothetical protein
MVNVLSLLFYHNTVLLSKFYNAFVSVLKVKTIMKSLSRYFNNVIMLTIYHLWRYAFFSVFINAFIEQRTLM